MKTPDLVKKISSGNTGFHYLKEVVTEPPMDLRNHAADDAVRIKQSVCHSISIDLVAYRIGSKSIM